MHHGTYDLTSGELLAIGTGPTDFDPSGLQPLGPGSGMIELPEKSWDYYVDTSGLEDTPVPKSNFNLSISSMTLLADGTDQVTISNIPVGTLVTWPDGVETVIDSGSIVFSVDLAGEYVFSFEAIPYFDTDITLTATEV